MKGLMIDRQSVLGTIYKQITICSDTKLELQVFIINQMLTSSIQLISKKRLEQYLLVY